MGNEGEQEKMQVVKKNIFSKGKRGHALRLKKKGRWKGRESLRGRLILLLQVRREPVLDYDGRYNEKERARRRTSLIFFQSHSQRKGEEKKNRQV